MHVLISGAGIAGTTLAFFLVRAGARVTVVEKSADFRAHGQNIDVHSAALKIMEKMGVLDAIKNSNTTEVGTQFVNDKGRAFARFPMRRTGLTFTKEFEILRGDLAQILYDATKELTSITYLFDTSIVSVTSERDQAARVRLSNGDICQCDIAVAADGQWSNLRRLQFSASEVVIVDKNMYVAHCTVPRCATDTPWWTIHFSLSSRVVASRPDPHGTTKAMVSIMPTHAAQKAEWSQAPRMGREVQLKLLQKEFISAGWETRRFLSDMNEAPDLYLQAVQQIRMSTWSSDRVVCVGDAAYAPTPLTGMGAPLAIIGAYILAGEISELAADEHPSKALEAYERVFRPFVEQSQSIPFFIPALVHPRATWARWLLQCFIWSLSWIAPVFGGSDTDEGEFVPPEYSQLDVARF